MKKVNLYVTCALGAILLMTSCQKKQKIIDVTNMKSPNELSYLSVQQLDYSSMEEIFSYTVVNQNTLSVDEDELDALALRVQKYLNERKLDSFQFLNIEERDALILVGLAYTKFESDLNSQISRKQYAPASNSTVVVDCVMGAIGTIVGVGDLITAIQGGGSVASLVGTAKFLLKKAGVGFMVGYGIYKLGDCLEWW